MILAVAGGKGGVGTSTLSFQLGAALNAVVVDADVGMADLPAGRGPDLHDVLAGRADPLEAVRGGPVAVLPCGRTLAGARSIDVTALSGTLRAVEAEFGTVVVDCPSGLGADVGVPLVVADAVLLVTTPSPAALAGAVRVRALARVLDAGLVAVALNRANGSADTDTVATTLGAPVTSVPTAPPLARTLETGRPAVLAAPESVAAERVTDLAEVVRRCRRSYSSLRSA